ncbi:GNAT family N-acetyltransferase [Methanolobus sediminis]|uniref:GNAT family N-acetyltransferase n=1 Tax=Methanolobus sediminis TaxID=3072978 RepID=A0AA51ULC5_9EURY|nr:GNAT family N-acetyltransferase [Methanolobus sediminis]WMW25701.1 GNAT family N-acetyltransferase [Methanolobus sediminis]
MSHLFVPRPATPADKSKLLALYREVATIPGGIIREPPEVTEEYIDKFLTNSLKDGIILVVDDTENDRIIADLHTYRSSLSVFSHVFEHLTIAVHPSFQRQGIGRMLFTTMLEKVRTEHPEVLRVELITMESNHAAISLYKSLGFMEEGRMEKKVRRNDGSFEDDILMVWMNPDFRASNY